MSIVVLDIDLFKRVNDNFGHPVGDEVIRLVANVLNGRARGGDTQARLGGEEFAVVMPETGISGAIALAEELRKAVHERAVDLGNAEVRVTISAGCAELTPEDVTALDLYTRGDRKLYDAKHGGRDRVAW
ncbi:MAG TPA: GGDEF domain-containing protein [Polyangiaceae bacterium]|nr:GGDEF domain-containing protein [Polyangiaceae bacterium]